MPDKLTDEQIVKALECLCGCALKCRECPYSPRYAFPSCERQVAKDTLALITRQQAEIERLNEQCTEIQRNDKELIETLHKIHEKQVQTAKYEAAKEFAENVIEKVEKARQKYQRLCTEQGDKEDEAMNIHFRGMINIVKEMTGENNG